MTSFETTQILDLQPDWNLALSEKQPTIWVSYRRNKLDLIQEVLLKPSYSAGQVSTIPGSSNFEITYSHLAKGRISVIHTSSEARCDFFSPQQTWPVHKNWVNSLNISPTGNLGVSCSEDGQLVIWETSTGVVRRKLSGHIGDVYTCRFYPSGEVVLSGGSDFRLRIWSVADGSCPRVLSGHKGRITSTQIIERGKNVISASLDGTARIWDCGSGSCVALLSQLQSPINDISVISSRLSSNSAPGSALEVGTAGKLLSAVCENGDVRVISLVDKEQVFSMKLPSPVNCCYFLSDTLVACGCDDGLLSLFDIRQSLPLHSLHHSNSRILSLTACNTNLVVCRGDGTTEIINSLESQSPCLLQKLTGPLCDPLSSVASYQNLVYTGCRDGQVRKYKL